MMSKEFLKTLGVVGVTMGLSASPLALAQQTQQDDFQTQGQTDQMDSLQSAPEAGSTPGASGTNPALPDAQQQDGFGQGQNAFEQDQGQDAFEQDQGQGAFEQEREPGFGEGTQSVPGSESSDAFVPGEETGPDAGTGSGGAVQ